ncbi:AAA family ATPase [Nocardioides donggukensis]|uniref:AAA family ATPase n=1 Tax=Nocardioides donggukensis TaxID=2774019 RepID=A0A927Q2C1_9ACTN|nr:LuxR family transcriptional regulator [Nocardioides donggukensis]MBD8871097.1 AAA family ATPase [Nocardioides donggukensis]
MSRLVGRAALVEEIHARLASGRPVALHGPTGIGKSALLDEVEAHAASSGTRVLRARGAVAERSLRFAALQDLLDQVPGDVLAARPEEARVVGTGLVGRPLDPDAVHQVQRAWFRILGELAAAGPVLLLVDDAQWIDAESLAAIGYAGRRVAASAGLVSTWGPEPDGSAEVLPAADHLDVPALDSGDVVHLLGRHGVSPSAAQRICTQAGGLPALALALGGAAGADPTLLGRPSPTPASIVRMLHDRVASQPGEVRETLVHAALLHRPTMRHLVRAGRSDAEAHLEHATRAGLLTRREEEVRFTPPALAQVLAGAVPADRRAALHRRLGEVAATAAEQLRHRALADPAPDEGLAGELATAAEAALQRGDRELACELFLLAADRCPPALAALRVECLASCVEAGAPGNHADLIYRALDDLLAAEATPGQRVRVRLALVELAGTGTAMVEEVLTAALADAGAEPHLVADVLLQRARVHLRESRPRESERHAAEAVRILRRLGDQRAEALALPLLAAVRRWLGVGDHDAVLRRALSLPEPATPGMLHTSPRYMAARFAFYDDRLEESWEACLTMLAGVERGAGQDAVHLLRCLVETAARLGRCREALDYAARAQRVADDFELEAHPSWFITATAELVGGDLARARRLAEQGVVACEEAGDRRYLQRHLMVLGQALLRQGDARAAATALGRLREIERENGIGDPTVNRWRPDLVSALVVAGDLATAAEVVEETRAALAGRSEVAGTRAQLDRAAAELCLARGETDRAEELLASSERVCRELGLRIDLGRALLTRAHLERRRRRAAASREALAAAHEVFRDAHAAPWATQARSAARIPDPRPVGDGAPERDRGLDQLTATERRIARQVAEGASNREVAERLFLSVKTVEATLTRIYRKLGLRSRTQLAAYVLPGDGPA